MDVIHLDGVDIDAETGEILGDVPGDRMEWLASQLARAKANVQGWTQLEAILKRQAERLLIDSGAKSVRTAYGTLTLMLGRETVDAEGVKSLVAEAGELVDEREFYRRCCNGFNARAVKDALGPVLGLEAVEAVLRRGKDYVQLNPPREEAPAVLQRRA